MDRARFPGIGPDADNSAECRQRRRGYARNGLDIDRDTLWRSDDLGTVLASYDGGGLGERIEFRRRPCGIIVLGPSGWARLAWQRRIKLIGAKRLRWLGKRHRCDIERGSGLGSMPAIRRVGTTTVLGWDRSLLRAVTPDTSRENSMARQIVADLRS
jgi:hypothetical protein